MLLQIVVIEHIFLCTYLQPKVGLIKDVLATIGFKRTMDVLREAKAVQEAGGMETRDGRKPK